jgi:hypothetical protein
LKQFGRLEDFISSFEDLDFRMEGIYDAFFQECFISGLKDEIRAQVLMVRPQTLLEDTQHAKEATQRAKEATQLAKEAQQIVSTQTHKPSFIRHTLPKNLAPPPTPLNIQKLTRAEMEKRQLKGLCYNFDGKYFLGHKCQEQKTIMAISNDVFEEEIKTPLCQNYPSQLILLHLLTHQK